MPPVVMLDSSVLIDHFRSADKTKTFYASTIEHYDIRYISAVAKLEILYGSKVELHDYWNNVFETMIVVPFNDPIVEYAYRIVLELKRKRALIDIEDIMIAATALAGDLPLATLNRKHFERIDGLKLVDGEKRDAP